MLEFAMYIIGAYLIYYAGAIGYDFIRTPKGKKEDRSASFSVQGAQQEQPKMVEDSDYELGEDAANAVKKN